MLLLKQIASVEKEYVVWGAIVRHISWIRQLTARARLCLFLLTLDRLLQVPSGEKGVLGTIHQDRPE